MFLTLSLYLVLKTQQYLVNNYFYLSFNFFKKISESVITNYPLILEVANQKPQ